MKLMKAVFCYRFPEVRRAIESANTPYPNELFMAWLEPGLDDYHKPVIERYLQYHQSSLPSLGEYKHSYPTAGSSEGIFHYLARLSARGVKRIITFEGEYEGYREYGKELGIETQEIPIGADVRQIPKSHFFVSNPSAIDGNIISNETIEDICEAGHHVFYDLAYVGATRPHVFDLSHPNIEAAVVSFSKPFGMFGDRIGFLFSREPVQSLYANKWFKNLQGLVNADAVMMAIGPYELYERYMPLQEEIVLGLNHELGLLFIPSDALLLAHIKKAGYLSEEQQQLLQQFRRGPGYRVCLSRYFLERDAECQEIHIGISSRLGSGI